MLVRAFGRTAVLLDADRIGELLYVPSAVFRQRLGTSDHAWIKHVDATSEINLQAVEAEILKVLSSRSIVEVDGAAAMEHVVSVLTEKRCQYNKRKDGLWLTRWLLENDSDAPREVADVLRDALGKNEEALPGSLPEGLSV